MMDRTSYAPQYKTFCQKAGGNVVSSVNQCLKKLDDERNAIKIKGLAAEAHKALQKAHEDLKPLMKDAKLKEKASELSRGLEKLMKEVEQRRKSAEEEKSSAAEEAAEEKAAEKTAAQLGGELAPLEANLTKILQNCAVKHKDVWTAIEKFSDRRWDCIYKFAKSYNASANGFRGFPFAIAMMVEEVGSKESSGKGLKGAVQTVGLDGAKDEPSEDTNKVKTKFISYSKSEIRGTVDALAKDLDELEDAYHTAGECLGKVHGVTEKIVKKLNDNKKVVFECKKTQEAVGHLLDNLDKAVKSVKLLSKHTKKEDGLGQEDAEFRDAYQDIPELKADAVKKGIEAIKKAL